MNDQAGRVRLVGGWQSMDSAPMKPSSVLLCYEGEPGRLEVTIGWYDDFGNWRGFDCDDLVSILDPLCWQPLPSPPESVTG